MWWLSLLADSEQRLGGLTEAQPLGAGTFGESLCLSTGSPRQFDQLSSTTVLTVSGYDDEIVIPIGKLTVSAAR